MKSLQMDLGNEELLYESRVGKYCQSWSPDGKFLNFMSVSNANPDVWTLPRFWRSKANSISPN